MKAKSLASIALIASIFLAACETLPDVPTPENPTPENPGPVDPDPMALKLVLNNGNWGANDASLCAYYPETGEISEDVFFEANNMHLGDLGQDALVYGEDIYLAVSGSKIIFVIGKDYKIKKTIECELDGAKLNPRSLAASSDKVYVTYYEGYLGEIDPDTYSVRTTPVGPNPEGLAFADGKVYVANSGGYVDGFWNTVSVVDAQSFTEINTIEVVCNPGNVVANTSGSMVYVVSVGNYVDIPSCLQVIDAKSSTVSTLDYTDVKNITMSKDDVMIVVTGGYDANWAIEGSLWKHDAANNTALGLFTDKKISPYYSVSADINTGEVFVGASDYKTNGDVYYFNASGKLLDKFDSNGINPQKVIGL